MSSKTSIALTAKALEITKTQFCYGHRKYIPVEQFPKNMVGRPRAHCNKCMEGRKAHVKPKVKE